ncbi:hypothetical protein Msil_1536 [Methylocella silvestris BL2]|uniref:Uncharacterized protein n=1 Tax=Methylocella silvestris (strain DSM 15510 / CIP 108128 / LMG 27833 / NCIMB 13906 / BL2) TaxID=395965 RepID=B8EI04_METSB|nr:hypothetical protein [Methylocella silvestris]ACK50486.1 hypothetical protein Msil_1536 [Methylocella silvestris BL2]
MTRKPLAAPGLLAENESAIVDLKEALALAAEAFDVIREGRARDTREAIEISLEDFALRELLYAISHDDDDAMPVRTLRRADRPDALLFNLTTREWICGPAAGQGVVSAIAAFLGNSEADVAARTCELFGRGVFEYLSGEIRWRESLEAGPAEPDSFQ